MDYSNHINIFMDLIAEGEIDVYNEFSLQHELGILLRSKLPQCKIEFERPVDYFGLDNKSFVKKEIDISIVDAETRNPLSIIELKYPRNRQVPEQMFSFCKDISFIEQLTKAGFKHGLFLVLADDPLFYSGQTKGIYGLFRDKVPINGKIFKPTGARDTQVSIEGTYVAEWKDSIDTMKYCSIEINN